MLFNNRLQVSLTYVLFQYCLNRDQNPPCLVVKFKRIIVMFDCPLDASTLKNFLPKELVPGYDI